MFPLRNLPPDLWAAVKARAAKETPPGKSYGIGGIVQQLLEVYAAVGMAPIRALLGSPKAPPTDFAIKALDAAALWPPEKMRALADTIERDPHFAICEAQYLRGIANRIESARHDPHGGE